MNVVVIVGDVVNDQAAWLASLGIPVRFYGRATDTDVPPRGGGPDREGRPAGVARLDGAGPADAAREAVKTAVRAIGHMGGRPQLLDAGAGRDHRS